MFMEVADWLRGLGLGQYEAAFRENAIEAEVLPDLTDGDLVQLGVLLGHRKRLLKAIANLGAPSPEAAPPIGAPADAAERRQLTVMFSDLVGSTALSSRLDPEDMRRVIRAYQDAVSGVVARYDGFVAKFMGDGVLAYFGFPRAHEDDAARAVHAGLEIAAVVSGLDAPARERLAARIGVATGLVVVGDIVGEGAAQEQAVVGDTPNLAARLQGLAEAGGVVLSAATRRLLGDAFRLKPLGKHAVKGLAEPVEAYSALGVAASESRFEAAHARLTGFVGREAEAADLVARQRRAFEGRGQIVLISGEAGIGKSRLSAWVAEQAAEIPHTRLRYQCSPYHRDSALYPFAQQLERAAELAALDSAEAKLDKLEKLLALATDRLDEVAPLIAAMLSIPTGTRYPPQNLSPAQQRRQTLFALLDQMEGLAKTRPVLMLFEDAHWADATSLEVLDLAIERMRKLPVLLLITHRPEFEPPWKGLPDVAEIALGKLEPAQAEALVGQVTGGRKLPPEVLAQIVAKTDGVPLFVEELTKNVLESGLLIEETDRYRLDGPLPPLAIPSTLQDSLMARLDRLAAVKEIAQIGAAIGREFSYSLLREVVGRDEATLRASLAQLEESELVFRAGDPPAARYTFKHALVQDTAYESLLKSRRQILHQRIAEALREKFPELVEAAPELIAEHYTRAGLIEDAIVHWGKAGDLALRRSAFKEAIAHLGKAIEMSEAGGAQPRGAGAVAAAGERLKLQTSYGQAVMWSKGFAAEETKSAFARVDDLAIRTGDGETSLAANYGHWIHSLFQGDLGAARDTAESFLRDAKRNSWQPTAAIAHRCLGVTRLLQGDFAEAREHCEHALQIHDPERDREAVFRFGGDTKILATAYMAHAAWCLGDIGHARELIEEVAVLTIDSDHAPTRANAYFNLAALEMIRDNPESVLRAAEVTVSLSRQHSLPLYQALGTLPSAWARVRLGDPGGGVIEFRQALAGLILQGVKVFLPFCGRLLAEIEAERGDTGAAAAGIDEALGLAGETGEHWFDAELHRIRGEILLKQTPADPAAAEAAFLAAIAIAQSQKARSFELRAALALAKLYQSTNRALEAHDVLGPALEGFSPTPEFAEIGEAKALLEALTGNEAVKAEAVRRAQRLKLQTSYGHAVMHSKGYAAEETKAAFARVGELAIETGNPAAPLDAYFGGWVHHLTRGELGSARETAQSFLLAAERAARLTETAVAHRCLGLSDLLQGDFVAARAHCEQTLRLYDPERDGEAKSRLGADAGVAATAYLALAAWCVGEVERARGLIDESVARAVESAHAPTLALAHSTQAVLEFLRDDAAATRQAAEACVAISGEHGLAYYLDFAAVPLAWARAKLGAQDAGAAEFRQTLAEYARQGAKLRLPLFHARFAEMENEAGDAEAALAEIDEALRLASETGEHWYDAELRRIRGEILLKQTPADPAAAEAAYLTAIAVAQSQKARSFKLRAALALAKLYRSNNRYGEAHDVLAPALEGFSPTPEFAEISEGQALLASIAVVCKPPAGP
jgi:class 3 adenylate cyclase/predicted ATPase